MKEKKETNNEGCFPSLLVLVIICGYYATDKRGMAFGAIALLFFVTGVTKKFLTGLVAVIIYLLLIFCSR